MPDATIHLPHFVPSIITGDTERSEAQHAKTKTAPKNSETSTAPICPRALRRSGLFFKISQVQKSCSNGKNLVVMVVFVVLGSITKERWGYILSSIQNTTK